MTFVADKPDGAAGGVADSEPISVAAPRVELPKGGGAIRGIGEKFAANPVTGTASFTVPISVSPGRSGFGPELTLSYDSGSGNGTFGFGWSLGMPQISRKTDKGLPRYNDTAESDVFILSGAEDLVPVLVGGQPHADTASVPGYTIRRYRPRVEGMFARIERWTRDADGDTHWRSISGDNVLTVYGATPEDRIVDPGNSAHVFSWLISETRDDKGNAIVYTYKPDDAAGADLSAPHEAGRGPIGDPRRTVNRYLKRIRYGNRVSMLGPDHHRPPLLENGWQASGAWMFEVVLDYGEHDEFDPSPAESGVWGHRSDAFSTRRPGFEVRTTRLCRRVLMFHHFPELDVPDGCLVRSTDLRYAEPIDRSGVYTFLTSVTHTGYRRVADTYVTRSMPSVEFAYSQPEIGRQVKTADTSASVPIGIDGSTYRLVDLDGYGAAGVLSEQSGTWFYSRNLAPVTPNEVVFAPARPTVSQPNLSLAASQAQFVDLAGDGLLDLAILGGPNPGFYEHDPATGWTPFRPLAAAIKHSVRDPDVRLIDVTGDGHTDILIVDDNAFVWHESLGEAGFGPGNRVWHGFDEDLSPRLIASDETTRIYLADMTGDGLTDLVRVRNSGVCYWPSIGYGVFGPKITLDPPRHSDQDDRPGSLYFDRPDQFDPTRLILADVDGSGTNDVIYLHSDGVDIYFNASGNALTVPMRLPVFPPVSTGASVAAMDLNGDGTACLTWSSRLPCDADSPLRYVELMAAGKPHLLTKVVNNLGAETEVRYTTSTALGLRSELDGRPWRTRVSFPVHVVEKVVTRDHVSGNRFTTSYRYSDPYFDGDDREFRGFARVDQLDTEEIAALTSTGQIPAATNEESAHNVAPVLTRTWFHTGAPPSDLGSSRPSGGDYFEHPALDGWLLDDTVLPTGPEDQPFTDREVRDAVRSLKGSTLRTEIYALDTADTTPDNPGVPYLITEQNRTIRCEQRQGGNESAVFVTNSRETISHHIERNPTDPRTTHTFVVDVDDYGNVLREASVGYGRRPTPLEDGMTVHDQLIQQRIHITATDHRFTTPILDSISDYRTPLPAESVTYELRKPVQEKTGDVGVTLPFRLDDVRRRVQDAGDGEHDIAYHDVEFTSAAAVPAQQDRDFRRVIEHIRTLYRSNDLHGLLPLGTTQSAAHPGERYKLAFTTELLDHVFQRDGQPLLPDAAETLGEAGGYVASGDLKADGRFPTDDADGLWWMAGGQVFFSRDTHHTPEDELQFAADHFFLPHRYRNPFGYNTIVRYDGDDARPSFNHNLSLVETADPVGNVITADTSDNLGTREIRIDYRVLAPYWVTDPNGNRTRVVFDTLGFVAGTAVMGKPADENTQGDDITAAFEADPDQDQLDLLHDAADPIGHAATLLDAAGTRIIYDLFRFQRSAEQHPDEAHRWQPSFTATITRETHVSDTPPPHGHRFGMAFSYSDGLGREVQRKVQAEPGQPAADGQRLPRWVGNGWVVYNNKGKPVKQYEPYFSSTHRYDRSFRIGVSPTLFYDPVGRVVATLHPNHTWEKVEFSPWCQRSWDVNDTVTTTPDTDEHLRRMLLDASGESRLPTDDYLPTWHDLRTDPTHSAAFTAQFPDEDDRTNETLAARKAAAHAETPTVAHFDALGRTFLTVTHNKVSCAGHDDNGREDRLATRIELDIENNERTIRDAITAARNPQGQDVEDLVGRIVMRYAYDILGNRIHQASMEAGQRWTLDDVTGKPIRVWDSRGHSFVTEYDSLRRPTKQLVRGDGAAADPRTIGPEILLVEKIEYGEEHPDAPRLNLRGRVFRHSDSAGVVTNVGINPTTGTPEGFDFKGNLLRNTRQFVADYKAIPDWNIGADLDDETFSTSTRYDALNRPIQTIAPHSDIDRATRNVIQPVYNEANLLERIDIWLRAGEEPEGLLDPAVVEPSEVGVHNIDYDAKGQRIDIEYSNGVHTRYEYQPLTFRLARLTTERPPAVFADDCPADPDPAWRGCRLQNLHYTYDPVGNITHIRDSAQQRLFFNNRKVDPSNDYTYDALYRLIQGIGREHLAQGRPIPHSHDDAAGTRLHHLGDGTAMGTYIEQYLYDAVGNFAAMKHRLTDDAQPGWTRRYVYAESSLLEDGSGNSLNKYSNRLTRTEVAGGVEEYTHDAHGNITRMPHLGDGSPAPNMHWDYKDQLRHTTHGGGGNAYYVYDASGERVRKIWEKSAGRTEERIYSSGFEIYRRHNGAIAVGSASLERETLHVMDDRHRIALVETRTLDSAGGDQAPEQLVRYQIGNHLGSSSIELDSLAEIISYEEYTPYGSSSYRAVRNEIETPNRYRYTGKERDEENGLTYHGARYYSPWIGRWTVCDPAGISDGLNAYAYVSTRPTALTDSTGQAGKAPQGGLTISRESRISATKLNEMIQQSKRMPEWMKKAFSVQGNRLMVSTRVSLPRNAKADVIPAWFKSAATAIQSGQWHMTTGAAVVATSESRPEQRLVGDHEAGDSPVGGPKIAGMMTGETVVSKSSGEYGRRMIDSHASGESDSRFRRPGTEVTPAQGLIIVADRFRSSFKSQDETQRDGDAVLETLFHELAAHAGRISSGESSDHGPGSYLSQPITDSDYLARDVAVFFGNPDEEAKIKGLKNVWESLKENYPNARRSPEANGNSWERIKENSRK